MSRKKWVTRPIDKNLAVYLANSCDIDVMAALVLAARGIDTPEKVREFFCHGFKLSDPFKIMDMDKAVVRIRRAVDDYERICVYGDYDCDGLTATSIMYTYLDCAGADVIYYIPSRLNEGYGLNKNAIDKLHANGVSLIVTVDNGITANEEADYIRSLGIDLVITDHHQPSDKLPEAVAVVDPHRSDDTSLFKDFAGVGVAFKTICALEQYLSMQDEEFPEMDAFECEFLIEQFADLVALGTIADLVPLTGENRYLVRKGISYMNARPRPGISSLIEQVGIDGKITSEKIAYYISPRINAAGRVGHTEDALMLLMTEYEDEAASLASDLNDYNAKRHRAENAIYLAVKEQIAQNPDSLRDRILVFAGDGWHSGVMGIVASKISERYGKPAIVISKGEDGIAHGSCRSIEGINIFEALKACEDLLVHFGGHPLAAGLGLKNEDIDKFRERVNMYAIDFPRIYGISEIDAKLLPQNITPELVDIMETLEPFGNSNPVPLFGLFKTTIESVRSIGGGKHVRVDICRDGVVHNAVKFGMTVEQFPFKKGDMADFIVKISKNFFRNKIDVTLQIVEMRPSGTDDDKLFASLSDYENAYLPSVTPAECAGVRPDRAFMGKVYTYLRGKQTFPYDEEILTNQLGLHCSNVGKVKICLDALCECGLIKNDENGFSVVPVTEKVDIAGTDILKKIGYINR